MRRKANGGPWIPGSAVHSRFFRGTKWLIEKAREVRRARQSPAVPASFSILGVTKMISSLLSSRTEVVLNSQLR